MITPNKNGQKKHYVIYTRCSTDEQAMGDFTTLDAQAHHCKNMLQAFGYDLAKFGDKGIVNDDGYSGKDLHRPGIQSILTSINEKKEFDGIIFFRLDRLTRNPRDLYAMIDLFRANDIDFVSVRENLDSSTAIGRVVIGIIGLLSAFERELTGERVKASAMAKARQGIRVGGKVPLGYKLINDGAPLPNGRQPKKVVIDEEIAPHIQRVWEMAARNKSLSEIGEELSKCGIKTTGGKYWRRQAVSLILKNTFYKGYFFYGGETHRGKHQALVDEETWEKANRISRAKLPGRRYTKITSGYEYLLNGLIKCGRCGSHLVAVHSAGRFKNKFYYYECGRSRQGLGCSYKRIPAPGFDQAVIDYFERASQNQDIIINAIGISMRESQIRFEKIEEKLLEKTKHLNALRDEVKKLLELAINNAVSQGATYKSKMTEVENEITILEDEINKLEMQKKVAQIDANSSEFIYANLGIAIKYLNDAPRELQKDLLKNLINDIIVYDDKIAMNMFIKPEGFPDLLAPDQQKSPAPDLNQDEAMEAQTTVTSMATGSTGRPVWRP